MSKLTSLTAEQLRSLLSYDPETGLFKWLVSRQGARLGRPAGCVCSQGYLKLRIDQTLYQGHRLAWLHHYGHWPDDDIDHIDGDRSNNRINNLRDILSSENRKNQYGTGRPTASGLIGVARAGRKWRAYITNQGRTQWLGAYDSPEEASAAYKAAKPKYHPATPTQRN